jgi:hypothetical protein
MKKIFRDSEQAQKGITYKFPSQPFNLIIINNLQQF